MSIARKLAPLIRDIESERIVVLRELLRYGLSRARFWSSGTATYAQLRREGHPYARRHPAPLRDPVKINRHRGVFYDAWDTQEGPMGGRLSNASDVADFLDQGTTRMHRRPIREQLEAELGDKAAQLEDRANQRISWKYS